jgi:hypothetical protein
MANRISQAITDIVVDRTNTGTNLTSFAGVLTDVETALDLSDSNIDAAITYINTVNLGDNVAGNYSYLAKDAVEEATARLAKARSYLEAAGTNAGYLEMAKTELASAGSYASQVAEYCRAIEQSINVSQLVSSYRTWAQYKYQEYLMELEKIGEVNVTVAGSREL